MCQFVYVDYVKVSQFNLPMSIGNMISPKIELTEVYNRYLARQDRSTSNIEVKTQLQMYLVKFILSLCF